MNPVKEPASGQKNKISAHKKKKDPGLWLQKYLTGSRTLEETLFKINELLYAGEAQSTRKHVRAPLSLPVIVRWEGKTMGGASYTLSEKGMFVRLADPPPVGAVVEVGLSLPDGGNALQLQAEVIHSNPLSLASRSTALSGMSVVFRKISEEEKRRINRLVRAVARLMKNRRR